MISSLPLGSFPRRVSCFFGETPETAVFHTSVALRQRGDGPGEILIRQGVMLQLLRVNGHTDKLAEGDRV